MERLKALLYCLRCHLVLLIFVALAAGAYWLRGDLYRHFGLTVQSEPDIAADRTVGELALAAADPRSVEAKPAPAEDGQPARGRLSNPAPPKSVEPMEPPARQLAEAGDFSFRPLDSREDEALSESPGRQELLIQARRAYWNGNIRFAVRSYQRLIDAYPDHPDYPGELGNIYYEQGAGQLAASFYLDAARLLLERGERSRALGLVETLEGLDAAVAGELRARLAGAESGVDPGGYPQAASRPAY